MQRIHPVILCGGSGTRLWPRSRPALPKPFLRLLGERTLFQMALDRVEDGVLFAEPLIVAGSGHADHISDQANTHDLIVEPAAKNTAAAIALAAHRLPPEALMLVCPSDHHVGDVEAFRAVVRKGAALAEQGYLVSLGIAPTRPETGYGYIKQGERFGEGFLVEQFVEKPDAVRAKAFLDDGGYVWNAGIFIFRAGDLLEELERFRPSLASAVARSVRIGREDRHVFYPDADSFGKVEGESIDFAVMEHTERAAVVSAEMGWSDIGDWDALMAAREDWDRRDWYNARGDVVEGRNVTIDSDGPRVSVVGLDDVIVVVDGDEILVMRRGAAQHVRNLPGANGQ
ncbi:mannose-1-phosphate guanylyltransferase [Erythrobacter litoralis]|uniref:mannose-1-phosphate guanylyltransferase n=1 Tax=Erythrobacter litoralis TaxID=39960 RepID=UPI00243561AE|nr:mannose-1-phosphate guanylyltransferase [Erythrobacter litoralis]MDG6077959.1 mannose-1-phosphate guanylyltransferase [Erythrobacter litoralis]